MNLKGLERLGNPIIPECIFGMPTSVHDTNILKLGSGRTNASPRVMYSNTNVDAWRAAYLWIYHNTEKNN